MQKFTRWASYRPLDLVLLCSMFPLSALLLRFFLYFACLEGRSIARRLSAVFVAVDLYDFHCLVFSLGEPLH